jgi:hypothetical protein
MSLGTLHHHAFETWLEKNGLRKQCPFCKGHALAATNVVQCPKVDTAMNKESDDRHSAPMILVKCNDCGHVMLFAADRVLGETDFKSAFPACHP